MKTPSKGRIVMATSITLVLILLGQACNNEENEFSLSAERDYSGEELFRGIFFTEGEVIELLPEIKAYYPDLSSLRKQTPDFDKVLEQTRTNLINAINVVDPGFLSDFKTKITSGNHVKIKKALKKSADILVKASRYAYRDHLKDVDETKAKLGTLNIGELINSKNEFDWAKLEKILEEKELIKSSGVTGRVTAQNSEDDCAVINLGLLINVAIALNVAIAVNVALAVEVAIANQIAIANDIAIMESVEITMGEGTAMSRSSLRDDMTVDIIAVRLRAK